MHSDWYPTRRFWIGVDDKIVRDVHKRYRITPNIHSVCAFLADQVLMALLMTRRNTGLFCPPDLVTLSHSEYLDAV